MAFKKGDLVVCVNNGPMHHVKITNLCIEKGRAYRVYGVNNESIPKLLYIDRSFADGFFQDRFVKIEI